MESITVFRTDLFVKVINQIDKKYFNEKINYHDDFLLLFLLTRNAKRFRKINRIFYNVVYFIHLPTQKLF